MILSLVRAGGNAYNTHTEGGITMRKTLGQLAKYYKPYKGVFFTDLLFATVGAAVTLIIPLLVRYITNRVIYLPQEAAVSLLLKLAVVMLAMVAIEAVSNYYITYFGHMMGAKIERDMRDEIFGHYQKLSFTCTRN